MKCKRYSEEQIIAIKGARDGVNTADLCRKHGISEQTLGFRDFQPALLDLPIVGRQHFLPVRILQCSVVEHGRPATCSAWRSRSRTPSHVSERRACKVTRADDAAVSLTQTA